MKIAKQLNVKELNFNQLFKQISPEEISYNVFTLVRKVFRLLPQEWINITTL